MKFLEFTKIKQILVVVIRFNNNIDGFSFSTYLDARYRHWTPSVLAYKQTRWHRHFTCDRDSGLEIGLWLWLLYPTDTSTDYTPLTFVYHTHSDGSERNNNQILSLIKWINLLSTLQFPFYYFTFNHCWGAGGRRGGVTIGNECFPRIWKSTSTPKLQSILYLWPITHVFKDIYRGRTRTECARITVRYRHSAHRRPTKHES